MMKSFKSIRSLFVELQKITKAFDEKLISWIALYIFLFYQNV